MDSINAWFESKGERERSYLKTWVDDGKKNSLTLEREREREIWKYLMGREIHRANHVRVRLFTRERKRGLKV